jgi:nicotinamidase-related amidase
MLFSEEVLMANVELPDIPREAEVTLEPKRTALIVVDMQNDFAHPEGTLFGPEAQTIVPTIANLVGRAREAGVRIVFTQDWHGEDDPEFALWGEHAKAGTWGAEIVEGLEPESGDTLIKKLRYDAFYGTPLDHHLRAWGVSHLVVTGTVANICVLHTAGSAALRWFDVIVPEDAIAALTPFDKASALRQVSFLYAGKVTRSEGVRFR